MCGVKTNIVTAVEIAGSEASSSPMLPALLSRTAQTFIPREVSGDKEFGSFSNYDAIERTGACRSSRSSRDTPDRAAVCGAGCSTTSTSAATNS